MRRIADDASRTRVAPTRCHHRSSPLKAAWFTRPGAAAEVLQYGDHPAPRPGPGEVRVRLHASAVNPADVRRRAGLDYTMEGPLVIPDSDGSGIVDEIGPGADPALLNRRVWLYNGQRGGRTLGTAAEYIALDAGLVAPLPDAVSFAEGACLGIPAMTAHRCVTLGGDLEGRVVLVTGGAGAVGHYAVQWARRFGARVIATVSTAEKAAHALAAGAHAVVDYRTEDVVARVLDATAGIGVDHVVDVDFGGNLPVVLRLLRVNASIAYYATRGNVAPTLPAGELLKRNITIHGVLLNNCPLAARRRAQSDITRWLSEGGMQHTVASVHALPDIAAAHLAVEAGTKRGTVVVDCTQAP